MRPRMQPAAVDIAGRRMVYAVSNNARESKFAINIHGWFAGGGMYWRESSILAEQLGWKVVNPSLPGFGGSDPVQERGCITGMADTIVRLMDCLGIPDAVVLGHSMGGAVAVDMAHNHPDRVSGIVYRDGAATPAWRRPTMRRFVLSPIETADLLMGRALSTARAVYPDFRANVRSPKTTVPAAFELLSIDMREDVAELHDRGLPMLCVWGKFDQITPPAAAEEFCDLAGGDPVYVLGSHSWMLARPYLQARVLTKSDQGKSFVRLSR